MTEGTEPIGISSDDYEKPTAERHKRKVRKPVRTRRPRKAANEEGARAE